MRLEINVGTKHCLVPLPTGGGGKMDLLQLPDKQRFCLLESLIKDAFRSENPRTMGELVMFYNRLLKFKEGEVRFAVWRLIDRGWIYLGQDRKIHSDRWHPRFAIKEMFKIINLLGQGKNQFSSEFLEKLYWENRRGENLRAAIWALIDAEEITFDWQGNLVLLRGKQK